MIREVLENRDRKSLSSGQSDKIIYLDTSSLQVYPTTSDQIGFEKSFADGPDVETCSCFRNEDYCCC